MSGRATVSISNKEEELFTKWKARRPGFVADGVANEQEYSRSREKILFVLKEVNDQGGGDWDLREFMREGARAETWDNITRWVKGIRALPEDIPWSRLSSITEQDRLDALQSIAAMNLKKSPGGHTTDRAKFDQATNEDKDFLKDQFSLYGADWVICCGSLVTATLHEHVDSLTGAAWKTTSRGIEFHEHAPGKYVIAYAHPEARVSKNLLHYGLMDAAREIRAIPRSGLTLTLPP